MDEIKVAENAVQNKRNRVFKFVGTEFVNGFVRDGVKDVSDYRSRCNDGYHLIRLGDQKARIRMAVKGEVAYIRAFDRTFSLRIMDPVEQAAQETGSGSDKTRAPMPGTVASVDVAEGDDVKKGIPMMTIESMKILTIIAAPRDGNVARVHFKPGDTFDKNAVLITLIDKEK